MSWTQADIDSLRKAVVSGALVVRYDGPPARSITYQNLTEMTNLLGRMEAEVKGLNKTRLASHKKGF